jgi:hypothetical protein
MPRIERFFPNSKVSDWTSGAFGGGDQLPGAPGTLALANSGDAGTAIALTWSLGTSGSALITGYHIQQSTDGSSWSDTVADTSSTAVTYTKTSLTAGTQYWFRVAAITSVGESAYGNEPNHTTPDPLIYSTTGSPTLRTYSDGGTDYKSLQWASSGTFVPSSNPNSVTFDVWIVAGGGGGAGAATAGGLGGGGAGGALAYTSQTLGLASHTVTIGAGGAAGSGGSGSSGSVGADSTLAISGGSTLTLDGGGLGGSGAGGAGGSGGGGGGVSVSAGGSATAGQGYDGGTSAVASLSLIHI